MSVRCCVLVFLSIFLPTCARCGEALHLSNTDSAAQEAGHRADLPNVDGGWDDLVDGGSHCTISFPVVVPPSEKACSVSSDCRLITLTGCCSSVRLVGLAKISPCIAGTAEACDPSSCSQPPAASQEVADDGSTTSAGRLGIDCVSGQCVTRFNAEPPAGSPQTVWDDTPICWDGALQSSGVPSKACTADGDCTIRELPACVGTAAAVAINASADCGYFLAPSCPPEDAAPFVWTADSGEMSTDSHAIGARCLGGLCRSYVKQAATDGAEGGTRETPDAERQDE